MEAFQVTAASQADWYRNIVTLRQSVDLLSRFVDNPEELRLVSEHEAATKLSTLVPPITTRPFEESEIYDPIATAIEWPFEHPCRSRFSDGRFGVWYGARDLETCVRETVYHFRINTLASSAVTDSSALIYQERRVHLVHCGAMLVDLRARGAAEQRLLDPVDYSYCQALGLQLHAAAQPGVITWSARHPGHETVGVFTPDPLGEPRIVCYYTYSLNPATGKVTVERTPGIVEMEIGP